MPEIAKNQAINDEYKKNRQDVIRLIGYDPFEAEAESDKPLLYSQLIGYLDAEGESNEDMMRISSAISIVRGFSQQAKIDDMISDYMKDPIKAANNVGTIKSLQDIISDGELCYIIINCLQIVFVQRNLFAKIPIELLKTPKAHNTTA